MVVATTMTSQLVVDAVSRRDLDQTSRGQGPDRPDRPSRPWPSYLSVAYAEHLDAAGSKPSTGAVGSSYDNALAESIIGLYKTEPTKPRNPWKGVEDLEIATAEWVDWFNHRRRFQYCDDLTPIESGQAHYAHHGTPATAGVSNAKVSGHAGAVQVVCVSKVSLTIWLKVLVAVRRRSR